MSDKKSTFEYLKNFSKVLVLDAREASADGLKAVAEKIEPTNEQKKWKENQKAEMDLLREEKEAEKILAKVKTA